MFDSNARDIAECEGAATVTKLPFEAPGHKHNFTPTHGKLVIIGPTKHEDGTPMDVDAIPYTSPFYVGFAKAGEVHLLLDDLQRGNPQRLTVYGFTSATFDEVQELKRALAADHIRGDWFSVWRPLIDVIRILRG
jgi:hypothetical protein